MRRNITIVYKREFHAIAQVPDFLNARINGLPVKEVITDHKWLEEEFTEKVQKVGSFFLKFNVS